MSQAGLIFLGLITAFLWSKGYRMQGNGKGQKSAGLALMVLPMWLIGVIGLQVYYLLPFVFALPALLWVTAGCWLLRRAGPFGELFPHAKYDPAADYKFMTPLIDRVAGYRLVQDMPTDQLIFWRMCGWIVRSGIYGLPLAAWLGVCFQTITPILLMPVMGWCVAFFYRRPWLVGSVDKLRASEQGAGFICAIIYFLGIL